VREAPLCNILLKPKEVKRRLQIAKAVKRGAKEQKNQKKELKTIGGLSN
jgi:hypothetical protein